LIISQLLKNYSGLLHFMRNNKRVLHLRSSGDVLGAENVIFELCKHSNKWGYESVVGAIGHVRDSRPEFLKFLPEGIKNCVFKCQGKFDRSVFKTIRNYIIENQINLIHCHGYKEDFYGFFSMRGIPKVATNHLWKKTDFKGVIYAHLDAFLLRFFDCVVAVSDEIEIEMRKKGITKNTTKISNGIDVEKFKGVVNTKPLKKEYGIPQDAFVIGMVSSLTPEKGHLLAIEAFARVLRYNNRLRLFIIGDGPFRREIIKAIRRFNLARYVIMAGRQVDIPKYLSLFDTFLIPSFSEGLPMALLEAMAAGKMIIASDVGEIPNIIENGRNGLLFPSGSLNGLSKVLREVVSANNNFQSCAVEAFKTVEKNYSSYVMVERYCLIYDELLNRSE
jgi:glycosyltransferase involved in cell wall biosynthesis